MIELAYCAVTTATTIAGVAWALRAEKRQREAELVSEVARGEAREWRNDAIVARCRAAKDAGIRSALGTHARQAQLLQQSRREAETTAQLMAENARRAAA